MTSMITARVDSDKRKAAEMIFSEVGLTTSAAVNLFICAVAMSGGIPFRIEAPQRRLSNALDKRETPVRTASRIKFGLADGKYSLPRTFDADFDAMDADIANLFSGGSL